MFIFLQMVRFLKLSLSIFCWHIEINGLPWWFRWLVMQEILVRFQGQEDPLENEMATHSSILAWRIPWTEESGQLQFVGSQSWSWLSDWVWTVNFRMFKLVLEKAEEPEIKLPTPFGSSHKRVPEKHLFLLYWLCPSLWQCGSPQTVENSERDGNTIPPDLTLEKSVCRSGSNS